MDLDEEVRDKVEFDYTYGPDFGKPFEKIFIQKQVITEDKDGSHGRFLKSYKERDLLSFVKVENFREDSRQWKVAYDPYKKDRMIQIYGKEAPQSFQIRQKILQE